ncbi:replication protein RepA [Paracraurococcus lichenis]|uniref:Replication protein RepA n=1 Tax=Paracraurococcus lichenis TaxID=3064888 RepID=A0ABT9EBX6_9PROT|nr:replication protein RepA [Paracraurococcus sp. LOR1-02]MDO9713707.1 replication protein RepA [Paracraurococcus sp. LOR1-02]
MAEVHDLLAARGLEVALRGAATKQQRVLVQTAHEFMADENLERNFLFSGFCLAGLPHRRIENDREWRVETDHITLLVEPGRRISADGTNPFVGVPFGSRARLIMLYLQTEAILRRSREIELGGSLNAWMRNLGISIGGKSYAEVREQAERISRCRLTFQTTRDGRTALINQNILETAMFLHEGGGDGRQATLALDAARLSEGFFAQLMKHPVPIPSAAIQRLNNNSTALDVYCWLAYRLHALKKPTQVTWAAIYKQFGTNFAKLKNFKYKFTEPLALALAVYPEARVDVEDAGLILYPSKPPETRPQVQVILPAEETVPKVQGLRQG